MLVIAVAPAARNTIAVRLGSIASPAPDGHAGGSGYRPATFQAFAPNERYGLHPLGCDWRKVLRRRAKAADIDAGSIFAPQGCAMIAGRRVPHKQPERTCP